MKPGKIFLGISILLNFLLVAYIVDDIRHKPFDSQGEKKYQYLSKRIFISDQNDLLINFVPLRDNLSNYINKLPFDSGVYFEYLPSGTSIGINENSQFIPASLLKLPLAMGAYKKIENGKLDPKMPVTLADTDIDPRFGDLWKKGPGYTLAMQEAIEILIKKSDNTAQHVISRHLSGDEVDDVFDSLDIPKERDASHSAVVSAKSYSSIFRCLYLSCYLSEEDTNTVLDILTKTQFSDKIPASLPPDTKVAHKIGVVDKGDDGKPVFSDCGIVYVPTRPFILCLMAKSNELNSTSFMRDVSKMVYDYVHKANP